MSAVPKKEWHQMSPNILILDPSNYELNSHNIRALLHTSIIIQKFTLNEDGIAVLAGENGEILKASFEDETIIEGTSYKLKDSNKTVYGIESDFENKVWISTSKRLTVLDENLKKLKEFKIDPNQAYSNISLPEKGTETLKINFNKMKLVWFKGNFEIVTFNAKRMDVMNIVTGVMNLGTQIILKFF